jgi:hypothetical protein
MHQAKLSEVNPHDFSIFMEDYLKKYNLPIETNVLLNNLNEIIILDSLNNYSFRYSCFYYYFVAKALSENLNNSEGKEKLKNILNNLHVDENAYIAVFLIHHSKNVDIFNEIESVSSFLFGKYEPATLLKEEMSFFDNEAHNIIKAVLPPANHTPEMERERRLKIQDQREESSNEDINEKTNEDTTEKYNKSSIDLRKAIKTVEVMGSIIRNRAGSLEKDKLQNLFLDGMNVHLRILSYFIELIQNKNVENEIIEIITKKIGYLEEDKDSDQRLSEEQRKRLAKNIFWNLNFFVVYGVIYKIVHSLGSDKLIVISNNVCDQVNTPASFLIKHGILMGYKKNLQLPEVEKGIEDKNFSKIAKKVAKLIVVDYCAINPIHYRDSQRIETTLKIPRYQLK